MKKLAIIAALLSTASSVAAQVPTLNGQQQLGIGGQVAPFGQQRSGVQGRQSAPSQAPTTGVFCIEEMTATFCNVPSGPNTNGYGSSSGSGSSGASSGPVSSGGSAARGGVRSNTSSTPLCASGTPANELCD
jgi:hypothetical protein